MAPAHLRRAFGLDLACEPELDTLPLREGPPARDRAPTTVRTVDLATLRDTWPARDAARIVHEGTPGGFLESIVERTPAGAHRLAVRGFGEAIISADGLAVTGAAAEEVDGRFERFLVARVLPWTALVRGLEVFHAAAVIVEGRAVVLIGQSGAGKTSLATRLVLAGAGFLTDDVLAVDRGPDGALRAHPGPRAAGLRPAERARLAASDRAALGPLRVLDGKSYAPLEPAPEPVGVGAVLFVTRPGADGAPDDPADASLPSITRLRSPPPELLLASTFVLSVRTPQRLANLLDICAGIAATVPQYQVRVRPGEDATRTAAAIRAVL